MKRVLVCEDEDIIRGFVIINLKRAGYEVVAVNSGQAAVDAFAEAQGNFDIALLYIMMPGMDGLAVCRTLREQSDTFCIIMLTAKAQESDREEGLRCGADDYITKPFPPSELIRRIGALVRRKAQKPTD